MERQCRCIPALHMSSRLKLDRRLSVEDFFAYVAAVVAHTGYSRRFWNSLRRPGIRFPLSVDIKYWERACALGSDVIWLHTFGSRYCDTLRGRPVGRPRLAADRQPQILREISTSGEEVPTTIRYDAASRVIYVDGGAVGPVSPEVWGYQVSGRQVVEQWFSFRQRSNAHQKRTSPLDDVRIKQWTYHLDRDLLDLLNVIARLVDLEPAQDDLLRDICAGPLVSMDELSKAGLLQRLPRERRRLRLPLQDELAYGVDERLARRTFE